MTLSTDPRGWSDEKLDRLRDAARELLDDRGCMPALFSLRLVAELRARLAEIEAECTRRNHHIDRPNAVQIGEADAWLSLHGVPLRDRRTDEQIIAAADKLYPGGMAQLMRDCVAGCTPPRYVPSMRGRRAVTRYGETGCITGPASDPARCTFRPDGEAGVVESITPRIAHLTYLDD